MSLPFAQMLYDFFFLPKTIVPLLIKTDAAPKDYATI